MWRSVEASLAGVGARFTQSVSQSVSQSMNCSSASQRSSVSFMGLSRAGQHALSTSSAVIATDAFIRFHSEPLCSCALGWILDMDT